MALGGIAEHRSSHFRVFQHAAVVGALTSLTKVAAAAKVVVTARYFGASDELDAYLIAFLLPSFVVDTVAGTFTPSLVPALIRAHADGAEQRLARAALAMVLAPMAGLAVLLAIAGPWILPLLGSSFSGDKLHLTIVLFFSMLIWLPFSACSATWRAVLNAHGRVALGTAVHLAQPALTICLLIFGAARWGVWVLAIAVAVACVIEFSVLAIAVRRLGYRLWPGWFGWTTEITEVGAQYWPLLAGTTIVAGCGLVDQAVAGALGTGSVSALSYGVKVGTVLIAVGGTGMATAVLPEFSRLASDGRWDALRRSLKLHTGVSVAIMVPVTAVLMSFSTEVVRLIYERGQFGADDAVLVADVQRYSLLLVPFAVILLIAQRLATALGSAGLILKAGVVAMVVNIAGDWILPRWIGVSGVALASCVGHIVFMAVLVALLYWREPRLFRNL